MMLRFDELNESNSTIITWQGIELRTTQDPYVSDDGTEYLAHAVDAKENEYRIIWSVIDSETDDESSACDWADPTDVLMIVAGPLVGYAEAADILGWDKRRIGTYMQRGAFPEPIQRLANGPVWTQKQIEDYRDSHK